MQVTRVRAIALHTDCNVSMTKQELNRRRAPYDTSLNGHEALFRHSKTFLRRKKAKAERIKKRFEIS